jgi:heme-degrading monooxygenase HmoA
MDTPAAMPFAALPEPPYFAVVFSSQRSAGGQEAYDDASQRMLELAAQQPGYLGVESARGANGFGITVSYWQSEEAIQAWRRHAEHTLVRERGRRDWYRHFEVRVARVERAYGGLARSPTHQSTEESP